jgi:hypothetical protein
MDVAALAELLHEPAGHHGSFEAVAPAPRLVGLVRGVHGRSPERERPGGSLRSGRTLHGRGQAHRRPTRLTPRRRVVRLARPTAATESHQS